MSRIVRMSRVLMIGLFAMLMVALCLACSPSTSVVGKWKAADGHATLEFSSDGGFIMLFEGSPPGFDIKIEGVPEGTEVTFVGGEIRWVPVAVPMEKDEKGEYRIGKPVGSVTIKGFYRPTDRDRVYAFFRIMVQGKERELLLFELTHKRDGLYLEPKALLLKPGRYVK